MVGEIVEAGPAVRGFRVGDRVVRWGRADDCLARGRRPLCPACACGHRVLCEIASEPKEHEAVGGGFGDSFITPAATLVPVLPALTDDQAIFTEPAAVAIHAAHRHIPRPGETVLVLGCGTIGFLLLQVLRHLQPGCTLVALAEFPWQAELAKEFGAQHVFLTGDDGYLKTVELTGARVYSGRAGNRMLMGGFDAIFDVVGIPITLNNALRWTKAGGTVVLVGVNLHRMHLDVTPVWYQEVNLVGAVGHDVVEWQGETVSTFDLAMRWMAAGWLQTAPLLSHCFPLADYRQALTTAIDKRHQRAIKIALQC